MEFLPNHAMRDELMHDVGIGSIDELFSDVPGAVRIDGLELPEPKSELEVVQYLGDILAANRSTDRGPQFVGGTLKEHHVPAFVGHLLSRQEFYTSYTPYQAELSQGTLQALFEFQSMLAELTGLGVANASMYDASTALAEAVLMAHRVNHRGKVLVPQHVAPEKRSTVENYAACHGIQVETYGFDATTGATDLADLEKAIDETTSAVYLENPNFFGTWETDAQAVADAAHDVDALAVFGFDLSSLGIVKAPGDLGADMAVGDGTTFCFPPSLGGPQLGLFACRDDLARRMPGRLIGASRDDDGGRAYCMTLQTREQHIRRDKATSNICTNQSLLAVGTGAHLAALGPDGLKELGHLNAQAAARLARVVEEETPWRRRFTGAHYNEVTLAGPVDGERLYQTLGSQGMTPGYPAVRAAKDLADAIVACSTEIHTHTDHDTYAAALKEAAS